MRGGGIKARLIQGRCGGQRDAGLKDWLKVSWFLEGISNGQAFLKPTLIDPGGEMGYFH